MGLWRLRPGWPLLIPTVASVQLKALRVGSMLLLGTPCDFSGELALQLQSSWHKEELEIAVRFQRRLSWIYRTPKVLFHE